MGKLSLTILLFTAFSVFLHGKQYHLNKNYFKALISPENNLSTRNLSLDYIRLLATLFVIAVHCLERAAAGFSLSNAAQTAIQGVSVLFLTCNTLFVMSSGALVLRGREQSPASFYCRRFSRVAIPAFCYYSIYILLSSRYFNNGFLRGVFSSLRQMLIGPIDWTPHFWVIYVILSLYIVAPFFRVMVSHLTASSLHALAALIILAQFFKNFLAIRNITSSFDLMIDSWLGIFLLGYYITSPAAKRIRPLLSGLGIGAFVLSLLIITLAPEYEPLIYSDGAPLLILMAGSLFSVFSMAEEKLPKPGIIMNFIVRYSYSILLIHWAVLAFICSRLPAPETPGIFGYTVLLGILVLVLSAAAAFIFDNTVIFCIQSIWNCLTDRILKNTN